MVCVSVRLAAIQTCSSRNGYDPVALVKHIYESLMHGKSVYEMFKELVSNQQIVEKDFMLGHVYLLQDR